LNWVEVLRSSKACNCDECLAGTFRLHVGDRVSISGNVDPTVRSIFQARLNEKGVRVQGQVTGKTDLLVVSDLSEKSRSHDLANQFGVHVCQSYQLDSLADNVAPNGRFIYQAVPINFKSLELSGKRVFLLELDPQPSQLVQKAITKRGGTVAQQLRESIACLVTQSANEGNPEVLIAKSYGIPVFYVEDLIKSSALA